jgi:DNA-binding Xre family transcriptional regulator
LDFENKHSYLCPTAALTNKIVRKGTNKYTVFHYVKSRKMPKARIDHTAIKPLARRLERAIYKKKFSKTDISRATGVSLHTMTRLTGGCHIEVVKAEALDNFLTEKGL